MTRPWQTNLGRKGRGSRPQTSLGLSGAQQPAVDQHVDARVEDASPELVGNRLFTPLFG